jgi:uncharacterized membrane protein YfcA
MDMSLLLLTIGFCFIQTIIGLCSDCFTFLLFVMPLPEAVSYISIFYMISAPIYVYKEWQHIDKNLIKKIAPSFSGFGYFVLMYGKPLILKKALGVFIILFVLNSLRVKRNRYYLKDETLFWFFRGFFSGVFSTGGLCM